MSVCEPRGVRRRLKLDGSYTDVKAVSTEVLSKRTKIHKHSSHELDVAVMSTGLCRLSLHMVAATNTIPVVCDNAFTSPRVFGVGLVISSCR